MDACALRALCGSTGVLSHFLGVHRARFILLDSRSTEVYMYWYTHFAVKVMLLGPANGNCACSCLRCVCSTLFVKKYPCHVPSLYCLKTSDHKGVSKWSRFCLHQKFRDACMRHGMNEYGVHSQVCQRRGRAGGSVQHGMRIRCPQAEGECPHVHGGCF